MSASVISPACSMEPPVPNLCWAIARARTELQPASVRRHRRSARIREVAVPAVRNAAALRLDLDLVEFECHEDRTEKNDRCPMSASHRSALTNGKTACQVFRPSPQSPTVRESLIRTMRCRVRSSDRVQPEAVVIRRRVFKELSRLVDDFASRTTRPLADALDAPTPRDRSRRSTRSHRDLGQ